MNRIQSLLSVGLCLFALLSGVVAQAAPERWEKVIQRFEKQDVESPPAKGQILFIGSSSIVGWDLEKYFPELDALNRGFGGSEIADSNFYFKRMVTSYEPRKIVLYAGDNDIAGGKNAETVVADFKVFYAKVKAEVPGCPVIYVGIKPSIARWNLWPEMKAANDAIAAMAEKDEQLTFFDTAVLTLGEDGKPRADLLKKDGLHLTPPGYEIWSDAIRPLLVRTNESEKE